ncbi:glutaminyl-peptide cyclotransferase family protein [Aspergillus mulundensis]|uniref:Peptide hydrolase n=1 Tax=Aspergillus mulundensis TaxID=1810919 RepID=A0A3D8S5N7_9EURO|nr:Peptide hydrolase [Aspergillus mulundensis]RDW81381.1 Peptide hydrolase [Aspergillus mulundensis]
MRSATECMHRALLSIWLAVLFFLLPSEAYRDVSDGTLKALPRPGKDFDIHDGAILSPILIPRVPGTPGSTKVLNHFTDFFRTSLPKWNVEFQNSTYVTPVSDGKEVPFVNFIAYRDPPNAAKGDVGRLTLVAHYDSKYEPKGFIGAIDSAAPCAMIMHAMRSIDDALTRKWESMAPDDDFLDDHIGIQVLFLDGEEAFKYWTDSDSLYGARSLAQHWDSEVNPGMSVYKTPLSSISLFVLLDLLGSKDPIIHSFYSTTHWAYQKLANVERRLRELKVFKSSGKTWFPDSSKNERQLSGGSGNLGDDHVPFLKRGVEILHVIDYSPDRPSGFPTVWHEMQGVKDDGEHLDTDTVEDWSLLIAGFAAEWMELEGFMPGSKTEMKRNKTEL